MSSHAPARLRIPRAAAWARRTAAVLAGVAVTWLLPALAVACTVCMGGQEEASRKAFVGTTAFLTFFPLLMLGLVVGWFVRRTLAREEAEAEQMREQARAGEPQAGAGDAAGAPRPLEAR